MDELAALTAELDRQMQSLIDTTLQTHRNYELAVAKRLREALNAHDWGLVRMIVENLELDPAEFQQGLS
jgi:hypothetical protein